MNTSVFGVTRPRAPAAHGAWGPPARPPPAENPPPPASGRVALSDLTLLVNSGISHPQSRPHVDISHAAGRALGRVQRPYLPTAPPGPAWGRARGLRVGGRVAAPRPAAAGSLAGNASDFPVDPGEKQRITVSISPKDEFCLGRCPVSRQLLSPPPGLFVLSGRSPWGAAGTQAGRRPWGAVRGAAMHHSRRQTPSSPPS